MKNADLFQQFVDSLRRSGQRLTAVRTEICKHLADSEGHPTAQEIFIQMKPQYPSLSLATVYNTLDVLLNMGLISVIGFSGDGRTHFDIDTQPHINLSCVQCSNIIDLPVNTAVDDTQNISETTGFKLLGANIMYYGVCPACQKTSLPG